MAKLRAVVLAAGRGVRMGGARPKTLLPLGEEEPLLYFILHGLKAAGIDDLLVVTGFGADEVQEYVDRQWGEGASFVFNARYASWGNFHSLRMALDQSPGYDVLVVNSDVIVHPDVYKRVAEAPGDLVLAVQQRRNLEDEDMRVELDHGRVRDVGKNLKRARGHGEFAGVSLLRPSAARAYMDIATDLEWAAQTTGYYEDVYRVLLGRVEARAAFVEPGRYAEVDSPEDVAAALEVVRANRGAWPQPEPATTSGEGA